ncbi:MAG: hypothetical protein Q7K42_02015, partial [Candidatus Diapherotrites archaeon]|nr:hypothetical protein [Candidatus Diapherotrites archaeon]
MVKRIKDMADDFSIGDLYDQIDVPFEDSMQSEGKIIQKKQHFFVKFCNNVYKRFPDFGKNSSFDENYRDAIDFLSWDLSPEAFFATVRATMIGSLIVSVILIGIIYIFTPAMPFLNSVTGNFLMSLVWLFAPFIAIAIVLTYIVQTFPMRAVKSEQIKALTYVPEIVGYLTMSMKLVPNLEKAIDFTALHGRGKIAEDLK